MPRKSHTVLYSAGTEQVKIHQISYLRLFTKIIMINIYLKSKIKITKSFTKTKFEGLNFYIPYI
jgi:hypothetical protein